MFFILFALTQVDNIFTQRVKQLMDFTKNKTYTNTNTHAHMQNVGGSRSNNVKLETRPALTD